MCSCIASLLRRKDLPSQASVNVFPAGSSDGAYAGAKRVLRPRREGLAELHSVEPLRRSVERCNGFSCLEASAAMQRQEHTVFEAHEEAQAAPRGKLPPRAQ